MFYGIEFPAAGECGDPETLAEFARLAEEAGWDGVFLEDYAFYHNDTYRSVPGAPTYDPWICLAAMAMRTERVRLGTAVTPLSRRRPYKLAREAISLDHLSGGRLILGVGSGDVSDKGFTHFGEEADPRRRAGLLDEGLEILAGLMSGEPFSYKGGHYTIEEVTFLPEPVQRPRIKIWVGGLWPKEAPLRRAACWDGFIPYKQVEDGRQVDLTPEEGKEGIGRRLYELFFEEVGERGCTKVSCITSPVNEGSLAFHRAMGFSLKESDTEVDGVPVHRHYDGPNRDRVVFEKTLYS